MGQDRTPRPARRALRLSGGQYRFVLGSFGSWIGLRVLLIWVGSAASLGLLGGGGVHRSAPPRPIVAASAPIERWSKPVHRAALGPGMVAAGGFRPALLKLQPVRPEALPALQAAVSALPPPILVAEKLPLSGRDVLPIIGQLGASRQAPSRWAAEAYLFVRPGSGRPSLAAGGTLGGSQAAARLAYQLNPAGPVRTAVAARLYAPLASKGAEAALGFDWHPLAAVPLRLSVERRFDLDGKGRSAWSAYAAGGFYREERNGGLVVDGYGQAGVVGLDRRDLFVDGAVRAGHRLAIGPATATLGAGLWGAAQPGVSRLDVGPRAAVSLPVAGETVSVALEGRMRVAGRASPGSGATLTIALDL